MEAEYVRLRLDVERVVIACGGDLMKAEEKLKAQMRAAAARKSVETPNRSPELMKNSMKEAAQTAITQHQGPDSNFANSAPKLIDSLTTQACPTKKESSTMKIDVASDTWSTMFMGGNATQSPPPPPLVMNGGEVGRPLGDPLGSGSSQEG